MSWLSSTTELVSGGWLSSAYPGLGATGAAIKAAGPTGDHGAAISINDGLLDASEYIYQIASQPSPSGVVVLTELAQSTMTVPADGSYTWTYRLWEDGIPVGSTYSVTTLIGTNQLGAETCVQTNTCSTGSVTTALTSNLAASPSAQGNSSVGGAVVVAATTFLAASSTAQSSTSPSAVVTVAPPVPLPASISLARTYPVPVDTSISLYGAVPPSPWIWRVDNDALLDFACDWSAWLADSADTLQAVSVTADVTKLLVTTSGIVQASKSAAMVRPQQVGTWPLLFRIYTAAGRIDERTVLLEVLAR